MNIWLRCVINRMNQKKKKEKNGENLYEWQLSLHDKPNYRCIQ